MGIYGPWDKDKRCETNPVMSVYNFECYTCVLFWQTVDVSPRRN